MLLADTRLINPSLSSNIGGSLNGVSVLQLFMRNFITLAFGIGGAVLFFMLIKGGYDYLVAGSDKEAVQKAVKRITTALVGAALLFSAFAILFVIEALFGISLVEFEIPIIQ